MHPEVLKQTGRRLNGHLDSDKERSDGLSGGISGRFIYKHSQTVELVCNANSSTLINTLRTNATDQSTNQPMDELTAGVRDAKAQMRSKK